MKKNKEHKSPALLNHLKLKPPTDAGLFHSRNPQKWLPDQILGSKTSKSIHNQRDVSEWDCDIYIIIEKLSF